MQQALTYRERGRAFLLKAQEELAAGDFVQASEKGWGAAAMIVKAMAERQGVEHNQHRHVFPIVRGLIRQTGDETFGSLFDAANALHGNFYENWFEPEDVRQRLERVRQFVEMVEERL